MTTLTLPTINEYYRLNEGVAVDFSLEGINGVFRVESKGGDPVDLEKRIKHIQKNLDFFKNFKEFKWGGHLHLH